jgi:TonB family protein
MIVHAFLANIDTTRQLKPSNPKLRYPYKTKRFYPVMWPAQAVCKEPGRVTLPMGRGRSSIVLPLDLPAESGACTLVWNTGFELHVCVEGPTALHSPGDVHATVDLGEIHLASPKINRKTASQDSATAEAAPVLNEGQIAPGGDSMSGGLVAGNMKQPSAPAEPLPIGGDVKPARLISSVPPVVSSVARSQHASGDVKIDALIDANGRVTSMKIISGPAILRQSAMDALRQWKYQPATLDGNPVPMHLTVTLQFRLQ